MVGRWRSRTFLFLGVPILIAGLVAFAVEETLPADVELISAPVLLVGGFLVFEGYLAWRRERADGDNPK